MSKPKFVYVTYIRTTPEKLWAALTDPQTIRKYWFGITAESDFKPGSPWALKFEDGRIGRHRRNSGGRSAAAAGDPLAQRVQAGAEGRRLFALHDGDRDGRLLSGLGGKAVKLTIHARDRRRGRASSSRRCPAAGRRSCRTSSRCSRPATSRSTSRLESRALSEGEALPCAARGASRFSGGARLVERGEIVVVSFICGACMISSSCSRLVALAIGAVISGCAISQASATCAGVALCRAATASSALRMPKPRASA